MSPGLATWDPNKDVWELYNLNVDFSQANDLAAQEPQRLEAMKALFLDEAKENKVFPIGAGIWLRIHPEDRVKTPYTSWQFDATTTRMPEFTAPGLGRESNHVTIDAELGATPRACSTRSAGPRGAEPLHGQGPAGLRVQHDDHRALWRRQRREAAAGRHRIEVDTTIAKPGAPAEVVLSVDGQQVAADHGRPHGSRGLHRQRDLRRRVGPRFAGVAGLL